MASVSIFMTQTFTQDQAHEIELALTARIEALGERLARFERLGAVQFSADVTNDIETCKAALLATQCGAWSEGVKS